MEPKSSLFHSYSFFFDRNKCFDLIMPDVIYITVVPIHSAGLYSQIIMLRGGRAKRWHVWQANKKVIWAACWQHFWLKFYQDNPSRDTFFTPNKIYSLYYSIKRLIRKIPQILFIYEQLIHIAINVICLQVFHWKKRFLILHLNCLATNSFILA